MISHDLYNPNGENYGGWTDDYAEIQENSECVYYYLQTPYPNSASPAPQPCEGSNEFVCSSRC